MAERFTSILEKHKEKLEINEGWDYLFKALLHRYRLNSSKPEDTYTGSITLNVQDAPVSVIVVPMSYDIGRRARVVSVGLSDKTRYYQGVAEAKWVGDTPLLQDSRDYGDPQFAKEIGPLLLTGIASKIVMPPKFTMTHASTGVDFFLPGTFRNIH